MTNRTELLMLNFGLASSAGRPSINNKILENFNHTLNNTYDKDEVDYWQELRESKFIVTPCGMGYDSYRIWDALIMGTIPIIERYNKSDGLFKTYNNMPVLWVEHYDNVTPSLLEKEYPKIISRAKEYNFAKLTIHWWMDLILNQKILI